MMRRIQKWTCSLVSGVSETLSELENHEAVTAAALGDMRRSLARAHAHANSLRQHHQRQLDESHQARAEAEEWRGRAAREEVESRALECLRRRRACVLRATELEQRAEHGRAQLEQVERRVQREEARYLELQGKLRLFAARQAAAQATSACTKNHEGCVRIDDVFERWDMKISERGYLPEEVDGSGPTADAFQDSYERAEEDDSLLAEWKELQDGERGEGA